MKAFRELLSQYEDMIGDSESDVGTAAVNEMEALVKMARTIVQSQDAGDVPREEAEAAWHMLRTLAKETP